MRRPGILWLALGLFSVLFCAFLGFWLWAEFGFERTIVMYETAREPVVRAVVPGAAPPEEAATEEARFAPTPETPPWLLPVRWGTMAGAVVVAIYVVYLEALHRRGRRRRVLRTEDR